MRLPGFIDVHVHLREPGGTHKEDFLTGTTAALKGGFVYVLDMPNNVAPTISKQRLDEKIACADKKAHVGVGFHYGTDGKNTDTFSEAWNHPRVFGLKVYCNHTTGEMLIEDHEALENIFSGWNSSKPILVHAEGDQLAHALELQKKFKRKLHVCHISRKDEVDMVRRAKEEGRTVTAGVTPHHLFITETHARALGSFGMMKPPLYFDDQDALWEALEDRTIDLVETDHAPHTKEEKEGAKPPFGVPGLESAFGLLGTKLKMEKIIDVLHIKPKEIFHVHIPSDTYIEVNPDEIYECKGPYATKCNWSPFEGWSLKGKVCKVVYNGKTLLDNDRLLV